MSENTTTEQPTEATEQTQGDPADAPLGEGGKKALDAERTARKDAESRAADLQKQLDEIARANESALEKAQREAKEAQEAATKATTDALRFRMAAKHGISDEDAALFLTGSDEDTLAKQAARLVERTPATNTPKPDLSQGGSGGTPTGSTADQFAAAISDTLN